MKTQGLVEGLTNIRPWASCPDFAAHVRGKKRERDGGMKRRTNKHRWGAVTPTAVRHRKDFSMSNLPESRCISKCRLSERLTTNLQPFIGLIESDWRRLSSSVDPFTEVCFRQAHDALAKLYEARVSSEEARRP